MCAFVSRPMKTVTFWTKCGHCNYGDCTSDTSRNDTQDGTESMHGWCAYAVFFLMA